MNDSFTGPSVAERHFHVVIGGQSIECRTIGHPGSTQQPLPGDRGSAIGTRPTLVFLHEGLGCVRMWRDFPDRVCAATGLPGLIYSRRGYGSSSPCTEPRTVRFMHDEANQVLPALLDELGIVRPILIGHSDGASIALIHAGTFPQADLAIAVLAPHLFVEEVCTTEIAAAAARYETTRLREQLARYHADVDGAFRHWVDIWLSKPFSEWNIEADVEKIRCPVLAIQGEDDQYGTMRQIERIGELQPSARLVRLRDCRHSPHLDQPQAVLEAITSFCRAVIDDEPVGARQAGRADP